MRAPDMYIESAYIEFDESHRKKYIIQDECINCETKFRAFEAGWRKAEQWFNTHKTIIPNNLT